MTNTQNDARLVTRLDEEFAALTAALNRSTVQVRGRRYSGGSGVIWNSDGLIITNAHVARGSQATVELWDGRVFEATVTARDDARDLAALQVEAANLPAANIGNSDALRVGELVLAVGNPLGTIGALTTGIIHSLDSQDATNNPLWVVADIRLAPGNSGGLLADAQGQAIGINSMIVDGLGYAVPTNAVKRFLQRPKERRYLGVTVQPVAIPLGFNRVLGLLVLEVHLDSLAHQAGLLTGDVLMGIGGQFFRVPDDLTNILTSARSGDVLQLDIIRSGTRISRNVVVEDRTSAAEAA